MRIVFLSVFTGWIWLNSGFAFALNYTPEEQRFIDEHPILYAQSVEGDFLPYVFSKQDEVRGLSVDLVKLLGEELGVEIQLSSAADPEVAFSSLMQQRVDLLFPVVATTQRMELMRFSDPLTEGVAGIVVPADRPERQNLQHYAGRRVGVIRNRYFEKMLASHFPDIERVTYDSNRSLITAVYRREVDAGVSTLPVLNYLIKREYLSGLRAEPIEGDEGAARFSTRVAVHPENEMLQALLNRAINALDERQRIEVEDKWFLHKFLPSLPHLTPKELQFLRSVESLHYCIDPNWAPFEWLQDGHHEGLTAEYLELVAHKLDVDIKLHVTKSWNDSVNAFRAGKCQLLPFAARTPQRDRFMLFTRPYHDAPLVIATRGEQRFIDDLSDMPSLKLAVVKGFAYSELLGLWYPNVDVVPVKDVQEGLTRVEKGELDGYVDIMAVVQYYMNTEAVGDIKIGGRLDEKLMFSFAFSQELSPLVSIFNKTMLTLPERDINALHRKWLAVQVHKTPDYTLVWQTLLGAAVVILLIFFSNRRLAALNSALERSQSALRHANEELATSAVTDSLTQVGNRKYLDEELTTEIERAKRYQRPLCIMMIDVDHFKRINDTFGHQVGDSVLIEFARLLRNNIRQSDTVGRWGGEEFIVILPETTIAQAEFLADKLRQIVEQYSFSDAGSQTVSMGIAELQTDELLEYLLHRADQALYQAKETGRNRVEVAT